MTSLAKVALIVFAVFVVWFAVAGVLALLRGRFHQIYRSHLGESRRERLFLGSFAFFLTFGTVRIITIPFTQAWAPSMT